MHIYYSPSININGSTSPREEWVKSARQHADELMRIINDKLAAEAAAVRMMPGNLSRISDSTSAYPFP